MIAYKIDRTEELPEVLLNPETGNFSIRGRSIPKNATAFYQPVLDWLREYLPVNSTDIEFHLELDYFNSLSLKYVADIMKLFSNQTTCAVQIFWYYNIDDEDMLQIGEQFQHFLKLNFHFIEVEN